MASTEVEKELQELDDIATNLSKECATSEEKLVMERCNFMPENKHVEEVNDMNEYVLSYFESLNYMSRRIIAEQREVIEENKEKWERLTPEQQDKLIDDRLVDPRIRKKYGNDSYFETKPDWFPVLKLAHGLSDSEGNVITLAANPRDSIASVTLQDLHSKDQFSSPWSWASRSQEDLRILEEGVLEERMKNMSEQTENIPKGPPLDIFPRKKLVDFEALSKDSSPSGSTPGSDLLHRRDFLDVEVDGHSKGTSAESSVHGSKASLNSSDNSSENITDKDTTRKENEDPKPEDLQTSGVAPSDMMAFLQNW